MEGKELLVIMFQYFLATIRVKEEEEEEEENDKEKEKEKISEREKISDLQILSIKPCFLFQHHKLNEMKDSALL